jgi:addiction module HigA family antidote
MSAENRGKATTERGAGPLTPGAHLREEIRRLGLDQVAVSKATGVSRQSVNNIVNGRQPISRAMAGKLGRLTGRSSDYWLGERFAEKPGTRAAAHGSALVAGVLVNHQILQAMKDGVIAIDPFAARHIQAASIELTLGDSLIAAGGKRIKIAAKSGFGLAPGHSIHATTKERIELPPDYMGRLGPAARLAGLGILVAAPFQVQPGFKGCVEFCLFNATGRALRLRALEPVLSLEIVRLAAVPDGGPAL